VVEECRAGLAALHQCDKGVSYKYLKLGEEVELFLLFLVLAFFLLAFFLFPLGRVGSEYETLSDLYTGKTTDDIMDLQ